MSRFNPNAPSSRDGSVMSRWAGVVVTLVIAGAAMAVSWGAANSRLNTIEDQISKMDRNLQKISEDTGSIRERLARVEGRQP